ncbi:calponin homology domain-containing protein [Suillus ampliporus]|nr:calponin homology domain-containing protein [Suillus ampliporus]
MQSDLTHQQASAPCAGSGHPVNTIDLPGILYMILFKVYLNLCLDSRQSRFWSPSVEVRGEVDGMDEAMGVVYELRAMVLNVKLRTQTKASGLPTRAGKATIKGSNASVSHTINEDERWEFTNHINTVTLHFIHIICVLLTGSNSSTNAGTVSVPDIIDTRLLLNKPNARKPLNAFQMTDNNNIVIASATGMGAFDPWAYVADHPMSFSRPGRYPELYRLCEEDETIEDLQLTPDQILLRRFNYHLKAAEVNNFGRDVSDGENHTVILNLINAPLHLSKPKISNNAHNKSSNAEAIGCRKYLTPSSLVSGNPRLKLALVANLFNTWPGLDPLDEQGAKDYGAIDDFDAEGAREARGFTL